MSTAANHDRAFADALDGLHRGDFSRLEPLFDESAGKPQILEWLEQGRSAIRRDPAALSSSITPSIHG